jgi:rare lipoprotein A (peptidoglycan hydrolase)
MTLSRRAIALVATSLALGACELTLAAGAIASSGGTGIAPGASPQPAQPAPSAQTQPGNSTVTASGDGMTIAATASTFLSNQLRFSGSVPSSYAGATVEIERLGHQTGWKWAATTQSRIAGDGSFSAVWRANHIGRFAIRAVVVSSGPRGAAASPTLTVTVYRSAVATQYGPGFWGSRTACGQTLRQRTLGVANRTLKCGTPVAIYYRGRTITVPVIDRGPYANGADWDLTAATARALGIGGTASIGAVSLPSRT